MVVEQGYGNCFGCAAGLCVCAGAPPYTSLFVRFSSCSVRKRHMMQHLALKARWMAFGSVVCSAVHPQHTSNSVLPPVRTHTHSPSTVCGLASCGEHSGQPSRHCTPQSGHSPRATGTRVTQECQA